jgi:16S rRNA C967 or C1407 C5-methylase (RsmB/RsmF family)
VVYSTCSISDLENDGVLSKILRRNANVARPLTSLHQLPPHIADFLHAALSIRDLGGENDTGSGKGREEGLVLERTEFGWQILPDVSGGWGPIYFAVVERVG